MMTDAVGGVTSTDSTSNDEAMSFAVRAQSSLSNIMRTLSQQIFGSIDEEDTSELDWKNTPNRSTRVASIDFTSAPVWEPDHPFSFPVAEIPTKFGVRKDININIFEDKKFLASGSNADISVARLHGERVVIKMIKEVVQHDRLAIHEFDVEHGLLARIDHPHIVKILGAGFYPRKFLILQYLGGGTLQSKFDISRKGRSAISRLFSKKRTFTFEETLRIARDLAEAMDYLHSRCHPEAMLVHRDLKPDNIAFTEDGRLVLFDLGLCTIVRRGGSADTVYEMTGGTGSLRYMAPEVALEKPYNEKADVYSFAVILWQMAADQIPYEGASRASYLRYACKYGDRPEMSSRWPNEFKELLSSCWHQELRNRPSFGHVIEVLDRLISKQAT